MTPETLRRLCLTALLTAAGLWVSACRGGLGNLFDVN
jgi:hypothetical protein